MTTAVAEKSKTYSFNQLGPKGKATAIERWRECEQNDPNTSELSKLLERDLEDYYGLSDCEIGYSLGYSQGDGVAFRGNPNLDQWADAEADFSSRVEPDRWLREHLNWIRALCELLGEEQADLSCHIEHSDRYTHWNSMSLAIELHNDAENEVVQKQIHGLVNELEHWCKERIKEISRALEKTGYDQIEYRDSDEHIAELLAMNDYRFTRRGEYVA